jgi:alanine racemase
LTQLEPVELRLELKAAVNNCTLINDSYNADLHSLEIALTFARQQQRNPTMTVVLSDILESGKSATSLYKSVAVILRRYTIETIIGIGSDIAILSDYLPQGSHFIHYFNTEEFIKSLTQPFADKTIDAPILAPLFQNTTILLKGARTFEFERIATVLGQKQHRTTLEVNLSALSHNLRVYKQFLQPTTRLMIMVKAAAYGSGSDQVARLLALQKIDYLAVAYTDEGYELRQSGIDLPIMVMNVEPSSFEALLRYRLQPELYSRSILLGFLNAIQQQNLPEPYPIHLKIDTGMRRLGFEMQDLEWLCTTLQQQKSLYIASIFTHLAATDNPLHDDFTHQQAAQFTLMYDALVAAIGYRPLRHILNSGGINRFAAAYQMDMVRLGIGLYGIDSSNEIQQQLHTVMTLKATISQIKNVPPNESIGYNRMSRTTTPTRIATVSIGYADGLSRQLSNGKGSLYLHGKLAPIIGNVCMDMCMIDITAIPAATEGDIVEVFGLHQPVTSLANTLNTIPYELFTAVSSRVKRIYFQE